MHIIRQQCLILGVYLLFPLKQTFLKNLLCLTGVLIERRVCCPQCSSPSFSGEWQQPKQLQTELQDNQRRQCYKCEADVEIDYLIQPRGQKTGTL